MSWPSPAAFAAGLAVVALNQPLCDCFLDFGEIVSEMAMLLAFVLFGAVLSGMLDSVAAGPALILAALVIFVIRPTMLALLVVQANIPGSELLLATIGVVVMASITVHGGSATPLSAWYARRVVSETLAEEQENTAAGLFGAGGNEVPRITPEALGGLVAEANPPALLDRDRTSSYESDGAQIPGSIRVLPDQVIY